MFVECLERAFTFINLMSFSQLFSEEGRVDLTLVTDEETEG